MLHVRRAGMVYCWTMRAAGSSMNSARRSHAAWRISPHVTRMRQIAAPIGGFLMTIPATVKPARQKQIIDAIAWMVSPEAMKAHVKNGFPVARVSRSAPTPRRWLRRPLSAWSTNWRAGTNW